MDQVVICLLLSAEARVRALVSPCGVYGEQSGIGTGFSPSSSLFTYQYYTTIALHTYISPGDEQTARVAAIQRHGLTPST
jgi:hypothetical protein